MYLLKMMIKVWVCEKVLPLKNKHRYYKCSIHTDRSFYKERRFGIVIKSIVTVEKLPKFEPWLCYMAWGLETS